MLDVKEDNAGELIKSKPKCVPFVGYSLAYLFTNVLDDHLVLRNILACKQAPRVDG